MQEKPLSARCGKRFCASIISVRRSGLADAVDVTGEVEHLVGETPLGIAAQFPMVLLTFVIRSVSVGYFSLSLIPC